MTTDAEGSLRALLTTTRELLPCDAAALLRLDGQDLIPVATLGLSDDTLGRRFALGQHPRLDRLMASDGPLRFAADSPLPDPYDGLVSGQHELLAVHDCMGTPLRHAGRVWGLLTLDALNPVAFDAVEPARFRSVVSMLQAGIAAAETILALEQQATHERALAHELRHQSVPRQLLGKSPPMLALLREIDTVAASDLTVLILGETGVGKELVAHRLHEQSPRREQALVQINCAALPEALADSELFGHTRGAFTGAQQERIGKFELANGGTLFLDEVGELPLSVQAKLLRVLQSGELQRPGSDKMLRVNVRVLAATNRDLRQEVACGAFRADLYHRLAVYPLKVPPLRERGRDLLTLAGSILEENQLRLGVRNLRLSPTATAALLAHSWPGNVRELDHLTSRAALRALSEQGRGGRWLEIEPHHLALDPSASPEVVSTTPPPSTSEPVGETLREATEAFQRRWIGAALQRHQGTMAAAAREAGMDRSNFLRLMRRLGLTSVEAEDE